MSFCNDPYFSVVVNNMASAMSTQLFKRDAEHAEEWVGQQEAWLSKDDLGESVEDVEMLLKGLDDFDKSVFAEVSGSCSMFEIFFTPSPNCLLIML